MADCDCKKTPTVAFMNAQPGCLDRILEYLTETDPLLFVPALRAIGNICSGNEVNLITKFIKSGNIIQKLLVVILKNEKVSSITIMKECMWVLSNIAAGDLDHISSIVANNDMMMKIFECCFSPNLDVRKESLWIACNCVTGSNKEFAEHILTINGGEVIKVISTGLHLQDIRLIRNLMEAMENLLNLDVLNGWIGQESVSYHFEIYGGIDALEEQMKNPNYDIY